MNYDPNSCGRDPYLWELAKRRASFKIHLFVFLIINSFLWIYWYLSEGRVFAIDYVPWPTWVTLSWGVPLLLHCMSAYMVNGLSAIEREYNKLQSKGRRKQVMELNRPRQEAIEDTNIQRFAQKGA